MTAKPRLSYTEFQASLVPNLESLEWGKTKLYLDGEEVIYAGHHADTVIWIKRKNTTKCYRQADVMSRLQEIGLEILRRVNAYQKAVKALREIAKYTDFCAIGSEARKANELARAVLAECEEG